MHTNSGDADELDTRWTRKRRVLLRLCGAKRFDQWVTVRELLIYGAESTVQSSLRRLLKEGLIERQKRQPVKGRWFWVYRATDAGLVVQEHGGYPRGVCTPSSPEVNVYLKPLADVLDTDGVYWEMRQVSVKVDDYSSNLIRAACDPPKGKWRDRAKQMSYSEASFAFTITKRGTCTITLKGPEWEKELKRWLISTGLSRAQADVILGQVRHQIPGGWSRIEIPVLEPSIKRLNVRATVRTAVGDDMVESNINYSMDIGLEIFGTTKWVDMLLAVLAGLQHSTVVSEVSRNQTLADIMALLEEQRREREAKEEAEKKEREKKAGDYYV